MKITMNKEYRIGINSFERFSEIQEMIKTSKDSEIEIDCTNTTYISPAFATLLGSLPHFGEFYAKKVVIKYNSKIGKRYISDIGIDKYYKVYGKTSKKAVPFSSVDWRETEKNQMEVVDSILKQLPNNLDEEEKGILTSMIGEVFINAKDHSGFQKSKNIRVYYCGYWNSKKDTYIVSIYDTGVGISQNVSGYLGRQMSDEEALVWAFGDGNSTQNLEGKDYIRGIGLNSLEKIITANNGNLYLGSGDAICVIKDGQRQVKKLKKSLRGTVYVFTLKIGENHKVVVL